MKYLFQFIVVMIVMICVASLYQEREDCYRTHYSASATCRTDTSLYHEREDCYWTACAFYPSCRTDVIHRIERCAENHGLHRKFYCCPYTTTPSPTTTTTARPTPPTPSPTTAHPTPPTPSPTTARPTPPTPPTPAHT